MGFVLFVVLILIALATFFLGLVALSIGGGSGDDNVLTFGIVVILISIGIWIGLLYELHKVFEVVEYSCDYSNIRTVLEEDREAFADRPNRLAELEDIEIAMNGICGGSE